MVGPVIKQLLLEGADDERRALVDLLARERTAAALRILALGLPYGAETRDTQLIEALGSFSHPLATRLLKEVIHRCNTERFRADEAAAAIRALLRSSEAGAQDFLREMCTQRRLLFYSYRRSLRRLAERSLIGDAA